GTARGPLFARASVPWWWCQDALQRQRSATRNRRACCQAGRGWPGRHSCATGLSENCCGRQAHPCLGSAIGLLSAPKTKPVHAGRQGDGFSINMSESFIQNLFAQRIGGSQCGKSTAIYKFEKIKRAKRAAMAARPGEEIIDLGVGEPDEMAFPEVVDTLCAEARKPDNRGYADNGDAVLKEAAARYLERVCGVSDINPETEVIHSIGSKAALSILPAALINPGDYVLMTIPGYPVFGTHAKYYGGLVHNLPLTEQNHFLPELDAIPSQVARKSKVLVLNYPNNPTGASATPEFFANVVGFARRHRLVVIHDAAYAALVFEGRPLSFLATPGAKEIGLELHSASKSFNMTGWRCGFVVGNELLVRAYGDVKDNSDSGQFLAIQQIGRASCREEVLE